MKYNCEVIMDLLPLYHDGVCSEESREMVEEHLEECESCKRALMEIRREISAANVSRQDAGRAWRTLTRNLWIRRVTAIILAVVLTVAAVLVGKEIYEWDQEKAIWMDADELEIGAYRLADGRVYVEFMGREHRISNTSAHPMNLNGTEDWTGDYAFRMGWSKMSDKWKSENRVHYWDVVGENVENLVLVGADEKDVTVICGMDDELPPATEEMEQKVAEWDAWMAEAMSRPGKGNE